MELKKRNIKSRNRRLWER